MSEQPHISEAPVQPSMRNRLLAGGVSVLAGVGVLAPPAAAATTQRSPGGPEAILKFGSTNAELPPAIEADMARNTVYLSGLGCSGRALRNNQGDVIGVVTAQHCGLQEDDNERIKGSDGKHYIVQKQPIRAQTGARLSRLKTAAKIDRFILPANGDNTRDIALGVAEGHLPAEVDRAYRDSALSLKELQGMRAGQTVYMAGWPVYQPRSGSKIMQRQEFAMRAKALGYGNTTKTHDVKLLWADVVASKDGASCSFGASGSEGFVIVNGKVRSVGTLSEFQDLAGKVPGSSNWTNSSQPTLSLKKGNVVANCGFAFEPPHLGKDVVVYSVRSTKEIPGYVSPEQAIEDLRSKLHDPTYTRTELDGILSLPAVKGGPVLGDDAITLIDKPIVEHNRAAGGVVIAFADPTAPDHLGFSFMPDKYLEGLSIFAHDPSAESVDLIKSAGELEYAVDPSGTSTGSLSDSKLGQIGRVYSKTPQISGLIYGLGVNANNLYTYPTEQGMK